MNAKGPLTYDTLTLTYRLATAEEATEAERRLALSERYATLAAHLATATTALNPTSAEAQEAQRTITWLMGGARLLLADIHLSERGAALTAPPAD